MRTFFLGVSPRIVFVLSFFCFQTYLFSQTKKTTAKSAKEAIEQLGGIEESKDQPRKEDEEATQKKKREEEKFYAKLQHPPGFYQGAFFISFIGGSSLAPSGSFINHEREYDAILQRRIYNREVSQGPFVSPEGRGIYFKPTYSTGPASQFDFEYAWQKKIGLGFTIMRNSISAKRQDIIPGISYSQEYADPVPKQRTVYDGRAISFLATYHLIPRNFFDPYFAARVGVLAFTGEAHANLVHDRFVYSNELSNGLGWMAGIGGGLNIYIGRYFGIKTEVDYNRQFLRADQFSNRTLNSYQAMIGVFVNLSNLQYQLENE